MIARTERGLLLTCLWYIREVDPRALLLTGLTRDGVYLVENGEVVGAVNNFRFNESPGGAARPHHRGRRHRADLCREWNDYFNRTAMPPIRVPDFNMSTVSPAELRMPARPTAPYVYVGLRSLCVGCNLRKATASYVNVGCD